MAKMRKPKKIVAKKYGKFVYEIITPREEIPGKAKFRTIKMDTHRVSIAYWGKPVAGKHPFYILHTILHPKKKGEPCNLKDRLKLMGIKELVLGREYEVVSKFPKLTGKRKAGRLLKENYPKTYLAMWQKPPNKPLTVQIIEAKYGPEAFWPWGIGKYVKFEAKNLREAKTIAKNLLGPPISSSNPRALWYVGFPIEGKLGKLFKYYKQPTRKTHGHLFKFVIGPFKTEQEAIKYRNWMATA